MWLCRSIGVVAIFLFLSNVANISCKSIKNATDVSMNNSQRINLIDSSEMLESYVKWTVKELLKIFLPDIINLAYDSRISGICMGSLVKMISDLRQAKVWAIKMLDATSKVPAGLLEGTLSDYGDFDECLGISVPLRNGAEDFKGRFCAIEAGPYMPPLPRNFSVASIRRSGMMDSIAAEVRTAGSAMHYLQLRVGVCVPSSCTRKDVSAIAETVAERLGVIIRIPKCYVKEKTKVEILHMAIILVMLALLVFVAIGTILEDRIKKRTKDIKTSELEKTLLSFSVSSNFEHLISSSKGLAEGGLECLHGFRAISLIWVMIGHTFVWFNGQLVKHPGTAQHWIVGSQFITNSWLAADSFFFLSGLFTCYSAFETMSKSSGKLNVSVFLFRRYLRTTPIILLATGLLFFFPLLSTGPFWYEKVDPEIHRCSSYWWTNLLYIGNWLGTEKQCLASAWFFAAEYQMHILSLVVLIPLYRSSAIGFSVLVIGVFGCIATTGAFIYLWDLPPNVQLLSVNKEKISETLNMLFVHTLPHIGPYCIGLAAGHLSAICRGMRMGKVLVVSCWCGSVALMLSAVYGTYQWDVGYEQGLLLTILYGALHRSVFALGLAWAVLACVIHRSGFVNSFLSSKMFSPLSRLAPLTYQLHALVMLIRKGSMRERPFTSIYNEVYEFIANMAVSFFLAMLLYLLMQAPLNNLERKLLKTPETSQLSKAAEAKNAEKLNNQKNKCLK